jgi:PEP-CTERM motif
MMSYVMDVPGRTFSRISGTLCNGEVSMKEFSKRFGLMVAVLGLISLAAEQSRASLTEVTSRASLGGTDFVDWGTLGVPFTTISNPFTITSNGGVTLSVSQVGANNFERRDQGNGWNGNFAPGDHLLWTAGANGPVTMSYTVGGVSAIGTQLQSDAFGAFTATITAFDSSNNVLGSFTENGNSTPNADNTAIFLGVTSSSADIFKITYSVTSGLGQDFGMNQLDFTSGPSSTPEPSTLAIAGLGGIGFLVYGWRRRRAQV